MTEGALNFADRRSKTDLTGVFDLTQPPRTFTAITAPSMSASVASDKTPPDDD